MARLSKQFEDKLTRLLQEEEIDLYVLSMHYRNNGELSYFPEPDRRRIKAIFDILIEDTRKHKQILSEILKPQRPNNAKKAL